MKLIPTKIKPQSESVKGQSNLSNGYKQIDLWALTVAVKSARFPRSK